MMYSKMLKKNEIYRASKPIETQNGLVLPGPGMWDWQGDGE